MPRPVQAALRTAATQARTTLPWGEGFILVALGAFLLSQGW